MIKMSVTSYVSSLIKHFSNREEKTDQKPLQARWTERWFGILPFLWRWIVINQKK